MNSMPEFSKTLGRPFWWVVILFYCILYINYLLMPCLSRLFVLAEIVSYYLLENNDVHSEAKILQEEGIWQYFRKKCKIVLTGLLRQCVNIWSQSFIFLASSHKECSDPQTDVTEFSHPLCSLLSVFFSWIEGDIEVFSILVTVSFFGGRTCFLCCLFLLCTSAYWTSANKFNLHSQPNKKKLGLPLLRFFNKAQTFGKIKLATKEICLGRKRIFSEMHLEGY